MHGKRVRARLAELRLNLASSPEVEARGYAHRPLGPGLSAVLGWDDGDGLQVLTADRVARYPGDPARLWDDALARGFGAPHRVERTETASDAVIWALRGPGPWVCTLLWTLELVAQELAGAWYDPVLGLLAAVPTRSTVYFHKLGSYPDTEAVAAELGLIAWSGYHTSADRPLHPDIARMLPRPEPLTPALYWVQGARLRLVPTDVDVEHARVTLGEGADGFRAAVQARMDATA